MSETYNSAELMEIKIALDFTEKMTGSGILGRLIEKTERLIEETEADEQD